MSLPPNIAGPFDVKPEDLKQINDRQAVELFHELLVIEATKVGIPATFVDVPGDINTPDGGIDAQVSGAAGAMLPAGLVSEGLTCYQIKTGGFSASSKSDIRSLLVQPKHQKGEKQRTKDQLQPRVLHCFENGGTFVVVLFGTDLVGTAENHGAAEITEFMSKIDPAFKATKVRVLRVNQLCSAIKLLAPGMALRMNRVHGYDKPVFKALSTIEDTSGLEIGNYHSSEALDAVSAQITLAADTVQGFQHVRILGDAGAGKTHLIYRALVASKLRECVLYCGDPEGSLDSGPLAALQKMAPATTIILVADDCDLETAEELAAKLKRKAVKMLLVSIHNASESASAHNHMQVIDIPQLDLALMEAIFKNYGIAADDAKWLSSLCEGSPRAAHKLGQYIKSNPTKAPTEHLAHLDRLWDSIVCSPHSVTSTEGKERLLVMRTLALFRRIAWETDDGEIVQGTILNAIKALDQSFSIAGLCEQVDELRARRILQGPRTLIISPMLLHVAMWKSWFDKYSKLVDPKVLRNGLNERMQQHFDAMLVYAKESRAATAWTDKLLSPDGIFSSLSGFQSAGNSSLFLAVAQASPKVALRRFSSALGDASIEERKSFIGGFRRSAVERLEQLAVPAETFIDAAQCLLLLAEAETESWSNNATGVFISLFGLGSAEMAASELAPSDKLDFLRRHLQGEIIARRQLVVQALAKSLEPFMTRMVIDDNLGLRRLPKRWTASTWEEIYAAYAAHVKLLVEAVEYLPKAEAIDAAKGLLRHARNLIVIAPLASIIIGFIARAASIPELREECIETIVTALHYEGPSLPDQTKNELQALHRDLAEATFGLRLRRHAGMRLLEDNFDASGEYQEDAPSELLELVKEATANHELLKPELIWLVTDEAKNGFHFGQLLGQSAGLSVFRLIISAWIKSGEKRSDFFVGGYLSAIRATRPETWECIVDRLLARPKLRQATIGLVWRSGMTDHVARSLLNLAQRGEIDAKSFRLFIYGAAIEQMPRDVVFEVIDLLNEAGDSDSAEAALEILNGRVHGHPEQFVLFRAQAERTLSLPTFIEGSDRALSNNMVMYYWNQMANRLLDSDPIAGAQLAARCFANFAAKNSVTSGFRVEPFKCLRNAVGAKPAEVWPAIAQRLASPDRALGTWQLFNWLRGTPSSGRPGESGLDAIPASLVFAWIDEDIDNRAWQFAEYCPPVVSRPADPPTFAREMLVRYGRRDDVRNSLHANHFTGSWSGTAREYYSQKLFALKGQLAVETDNNVRVWLAEHEEQLQWRIDRELELERREDEY